MSSISSFANISFVQTASGASADIQFYNGDLGGSYAGVTGYYNNTSGILNYATVGMDTQYQNYNSQGSYDYQTLLHEIGHAVGLKHSGYYSYFESGPYLPSWLDSTDTTVMSYYTNNIQSNYQELDIAAIQYLYGIASGSSSYIYSSPTPEEYVSESLYASSASDMKGGLGADTLTGSNGNDTIYGGRGQVDTSDQNDLLYGLAGNDSLFGNQGNDTIYGDDASSLLSGNDLAYGGKGSDSMYAGGGNDSFSGGGNRFDPYDQSDLIYGGSGSDSILGNGSNDTLYGESGNDTVIGGFHNDFISGGDGNDLLVGQTGNDTLSGGSGADIFYYEQSDENDLITDFNAAEDMLRVRAYLNNTSIDSAEDVLARMSDSGSDVLMDLGSGIVTISGAAGTIDANDIEIVFWA